MRNMFKVRCLAAAALLATAFTGALPASAQLKPAADVRIVFVTHGQANDNYWTVVKNGLTAAAAAIGAKVDYQAPTTFDVVKMGQMIEAATASKPDGLVVTIPDAAALEAPIKAAKAAGIPVAVIDTGLEQVKPWGLDLYIGGGAEYPNGLNAGKLLGKSGVKVAMCVNHEVGNVSQDERCRGLTDGLKETGGKVEVVAVTLDPTEATRRVEAFMSSHKDVDGMVLLGTSLVGPMLSMLDERGMAGKLKIGVFDLSPEVLDAISAGTILFGLDNQQVLMGYLPVAVLTAKAMFGTIPTDNIITGPMLVTKDTAQAVKTLSQQGFR
ncbi:substrate-binding domain-containing protein [Kaistia dalseonensis]|uniref:Simple sugar transport system substrate-binding protein n=1 Tax=Kaistia dalseonensis TaxID=410840 RepID=A0ABU0H3W4_9HYPH|nr:substrate-binding domain-containing protein [Kaistia dalseonensis]MCX5494419.1 substrate-binding domain-containing protein [Kaistia dalseonensis]MDQ0436998.1 simple sugar transport system substrate-binding protein [Kaistia dalseonensis]